MENGFFKWIWRYNGLTIAIAVTTLLGFLGWELTSDLRRSLDPTVRNVVAIPSVAEDGTQTPPPDLVERLLIGGSESTNRKTQYAMRVYKEQNYTNSYVSKESRGNLVNYVVVDSIAGTTRPLFDGNERLILDYTDFKVYPTQGATYGVGSIISVIESDTNSDGRLSRNDEIAIYFINPDWSETIKLLEGVTTLLHSHVNGATGFDLIYTKDGKTGLQQFSLPDPNATTGKLIPIDLPD